MQRRRLLQQLATIVNDGLVIAVPCVMTCTKTPVPVRSPILTRLHVSTVDHMLGNYQRPAADASDPTMHRRM